MTDDGEGFPTLLPANSADGAPPRVAATLLLFAGVLGLAGLALRSPPQTLGMPIDAADTTAEELAEERALFVSKPRTKGNNATNHSRRCYFEYNGGPEDKCFCQLAMNDGCAGEPCVCPQGCGPDVARRHAHTVTFGNKAQAWNCDEPLALLTIPKSYFSHIRFLKTWCPAGMQQVLTDMLRDGYASYKEQTGRTEAMQCIHAATSVSATWLHLHTFCKGGQVDHMPTHWHVAWCGAMSSEEDAVLLAGKVIEWSEILYGPTKDELPTNCSEMGCNEYGPKHHCSCNDKCLGYQDCCSDFTQQCVGEVRKLRRPTQSNAATAAAVAPLPLPPAGVATQTALALASQPALLSQGQPVQVHTLPPPPAVQLVHTLPPGFAA